MDYISEKMDVISQPVITGPDEDLEPASIPSFEEEEEEQDTDAETERGCDDDEEDPDGGEYCENESRYGSDEYEYGDGYDSEDSECTYDDDSEESESEAEIEVEGSVTSIGNRYSTSGHVQDQFEYEHVLEEGSRHGSTHVTRHGTETVGEVEDVYDEDIGGQSVASASVVAAGLVGSSMVTSNRKGVMVVALVSFGIMTIVIYTLWKKINEMRKEIKELEKQQDMGLNDKDVQSITTQVLEDFLRRETMTASDETPVCTEQPQGVKLSQETMSPPEKIGKTVDDVSVPAVVPMGLETIGEDDDADDDDDNDDVDVGIDTYSVEDLVRDIHAHDERTEPVVETGSGPGPLTAPGTVSDPEYESDPEPGPEADSEVAHKDVDVSGIESDIELSTEPGADVSGA